MNQEKQSHYYIGSVIFCLLSLNQLFVNRFVFSTVYAVPASEYAEECVCESIFPIEVVFQALALIFAILAIIFAIISIKKKEFVKRAKLFAVIMSILLSLIPILYSTYRIITISYERCYGLDENGREVFPENCHRDKKTF